MPTPSISFNIRRASFKPEIVRRGNQFDPDLPLRET